LIEAAILEKDTDALIDKSPVADGEERFDEAYLMMCGGTRFGGYVSWAEYTGVGEPRFARAVSYVGSKWHGLLSTAKAKLLDNILV